MDQALPEGTSLDLHMTLIFDSDVPLEPSLIDAMGDPLEPSRCENYHCPQVLILWERKEQL